jgi:hypothetical protein
VIHLFCPIKTSKSITYHRSLIAEEGDIAWRNEKKKKGHGLHKDFQSYSWHAFLDGSSIVQSIERSYDAL